MEGQREKRENITAVIENQGSFKRIIQKPNYMPYPYVCVCLLFTHMLNNKYREYEPLREAPRAGVL